MFKKVSPIIVVVLALLVLSIGVTYAQSTPARGGIVMVQQAPAGSWVRNFNPLIATGALPGTVNIIYEPLEVYSALTGTPTPLLATAFTFAADGKSVTYTLQSGVKWSDGQPFSA